MPAVQVTWAFLPRFFPKALHQPLAEQIAHTVRSQALWPKALASSARSRCPNSPLVAVGVEEGVGQVGLTQFQCRDWMGEPAVGGLPGELFHERVAHFPGRCA